jgi:hypothetical protein
MHGEFFERHIGLGAIDQPVANRQISDDSPGQRVPHGEGVALYVYPRTETVPKLGRRKNRSHWHQEIGMVERCGFS